MLTTEYKVLFSSFIEVIGTTVSALGNTPSFITNNDQAAALDLLGNTLQGIGNALMADSEVESWSKISSLIEATGNSVNVWEY